ncbi:structure-specific endonuclease subunit SLX1 homolog [Topomyia yanbarensis]|uniref:structure-specific endonuclease subunit SLX1 homolog n=1 Tax=Topomyia yanbarensis TaxID=2498891 RepID=UPI00273B380B|nr:structure-specific endonuclease subunit SLX1 homolog [Topomyia yanbarensis]
MGTVQEIEDFYGVYLLVSKSSNSKFAGRTYIGYTVDPNRRIKQHNSGQEGGGAKRTSNRGPWVMVMIIHGFPNNISALRFEWAWQQPKLSRRLKQIPELQKKQRKETNFEYNFRILTEMLRIGPWNRLPLTVRWLVDEYHREFEVGKTPPMHMPICFGRVKKVLKNGKVTNNVKQPGKGNKNAKVVKSVSKSKQNTVDYDYDVNVDEYDLIVMNAEEKGAGIETACISEASQLNSLDGDITVILDDGENDDEPIIGPDSVKQSIVNCMVCSELIRSGKDGNDFVVCCVRPSCKFTSHIECLAGRCLEPGQYVPVEGSCPICDCHFLWGDLIRKANGCSDLVSDMDNTSVFEVDDISDSDGD